MLQKLEDGKLLDALHLLVGDDEFGKAVAPHIVASVAAGVDQRCPLAIAAADTFWHEKDEIGDLHARYQACLDEFKVLHKALCDFLVAPVMVAFLSMSGGNHGDRIFRKFVVERKICKTPSCWKLLRSGEYGKLMETQCNSV